MFQTRTHRHTSGRKANQFRIYTEDSSNLWSNRFA